MKKMMIAAAVAAMAGVVVAADGYDFTASVKTTKGKSGSQTTTYYVNLGQDASGTYWWDDGVNTEKTAKADVAAMVKDANKNGFVGSDLETFLNGINYIPSTDKKNADNDFGIQEFYKGKWRWCYSFSYKVKDEDCYRVAGSRKIKGIVYIDPACCDANAATTWEYVASDDVIFADADADWDGYITPGILYRFGGVSLAKATKVEFAGVAGATSFDGNPSDAGNINTFALAGQGAWDVKNGYLKNISGNIVGVLENPDCESCCDYDVDACFFECDGLHSENDGSINGNEGTAAFGTWSMKYNKKY